MHGNPMDMFDEMDEIFDRFVSRMDREFMSGPQQYGYHIVLHEDGEGPAVQEIPDSDPPVSHMTGEPVVEVHRIGNEVKVIAGLPGITDEALRLNVRGNTLIIDAGDADHYYRTSAALPPVDVASMQRTLKNGVLEVTFSSLPGQSDTV